MIEFAMFTVLVIFGHSLSTLVMDFTHITTGRYEVVGGAY